MKKKPKGFKLEGLDSVVIKAVCRSKVNFKKEEKNLEIAFFINLLFFRIK